MKTKFDQMQTYFIDLVFKFWDKASQLSGKSSQPQNQIEPAAEIV